MYSTYGWMVDRIEEQQMTYPKAIAFLCKQGIRQSSSDSATATRQACLADSARPRLSDESFDEEQDYHGFASMYSIHCDLWNLLDADTKATVTAVRNTLGPPPVSSSSASGGGNRRPFGNQYQTRPPSTPAVQAHHVNVGDLSVSDFVGLLGARTPSEASVTPLLASPSADLDVSVANTSGTILVASGGTMEPPPLANQATDQQARQLLGLLANLRLVGTVTMKAHLEYIDTLGLLARGPKNRGTAVSDCGADCIVAGYGWRMLYLTNRKANIIGFDAVAARKDGLPIGGVLLLLKLVQPRCIWLPMKWCSTHLPSLLSFLNTSFANTAV